MSAAININAQPGPVMVSPLTTLFNGVPAPTLSDNGDNTSLGHLTWTDNVPGGSDTLNIYHNIVNNFGTATKVVTGANVTYLSAHTISTIPGYIGDFSDIWWITSVKGGIESGPSNFDNFPIAG